MKKALKIISILSSIFIIFTLSLFFYSCTNRNNTLKIGNYSEYIYKDEETGKTMIDMFKEYYKKVTGENISIEYTDTFTSPEEEYARAMSTDLDVICSSDYIIQKMIENNQAIKLNNSFLKDKNIHDFRDCISPMIKEKFDFDKNFDYSIPYMWGTLGISFNQHNLEQLALEKNDPTLLEDKNNDGIYDVMQSWNALWDSRLKDHVMMKRSPRDAFVVASLKHTENIYYNKYKNKKFEDYFKTPDKERMELIENSINPKNFKEVLKITKKELIEQAKISMGLEADEGKTAIQENNKNLIAIPQWGGDAYYSIVADRNIPRTVNYSIPKFGSNLFCDAWVIPKNAKNKKAANLFLNFMAMPENAKLNMEYIGYASAISGNEDADEDSKNGIGIMKEFIENYYTEQKQLYDENIENLKNKKIKEDEVEGISNINIKKLENKKLVDTEKKYEPIQETDMSYFFYSKNKDKKIKMLVDIRQLPTLETIERCFPMRSEGQENSDALITMWIEFIASQK